MGDAQQHIAAIRAALKMGPTPGPWRATLGSDQMADPGTTVYHRGYWGVYTDAEGHGNAAADAAYITACQPDAMRAILVHIEALETQRAGLLVLLKRRAQVDEAYARLATMDLSEREHEVLLQEIEHQEELAKDAARAAIDAARKDRQ